MVKNPPVNAGDAREAGSIPGLARSPGENGNPLQYSCLENFMDRGAGYNPQDHKESDTTEHTHRGCVLTSNVTTRQTLF